MQWNETIRLFRSGMPLRRHWAHFRCYDCSFTGTEAVDYLHNLLRDNHNFGPEITRYQTLQLLRKFLKAHVIEDIKGRHGTEDFEDNGHLYRCSSVILHCSFVFGLFVYFILEDITDAFPHYSSSVFSKCISLPL